MPEKSENFPRRNGNRINENAHLHYDSTAEQFLKSQLELLIEKLEK